jgi:adenylyltransferase/sulfurtransferase
VAALQVTAAFQLLVGDPEATFPLRSLDVWRGTVRSVAVPRDPDCPCCGRREFPFARGERGATSTVLCGRDAVQVTPERPGTLDLTDLARRLAPLGGVSWRGLVLELSLGPQRLVVFPDGRVLVEGTSQPSEARSLVARYLGW